jgi:hypothetical protein
MKFSFAITESRAMLREDDQGIFFLDGDENAKSRESW